MEAGSRDSLLAVRRYLLRFASQPQFFKRYADWECRSAENATDAERLARILGQGLRVPDHGVQSAAFGGLALLWRLRRVSGPLCDEAIVTATASSVELLQLRAVRFAVELQQAGVLGEIARKAAVDTFKVIAETIFRPSRVPDALPPLHQMATSVVHGYLPQLSYRAMREFSKVAGDVGCLLLPSEREALCGKLWELLTDGLASQVGFYTQVLFSQYPSVLQMFPDPRLVVAKCLVSTCTAEEREAIRSELSWGLELGTGGEQAFSLAVLYTVFGWEALGVDRVSAAVCSPVEAVRTCALLCLVKDTPSAIRSRVRESVEAWSKRASGRPARAMNRALLPGYAKRKAVRSVDELLAMHWLIEDRLDENDLPASLFLADASPANEEVDAILAADADGLAHILRNRVLCIMEAPVLEEGGIRLVAACFRYLGPDERQRAFDAIIRTCQATKDDDVLFEALDSVRRYQLPIIPEGAFREVLGGLVDHKRWAISDLAADLFAAS